jgi:hypothetical protein
MSVPVLRRPEVKESASGGLTGARPNPNRNQL